VSAASCPRARSGRPEKIVRSVVVEEGAGYGAESDRQAVFSWTTGHQNCGGRISPVTAPKGGPSPSVTGFWVRGSANRAEAQQSSSLCAKTGEFIFDETQISGPILRGGAAIGGSSNCIRPPPRRISIGGRHRFCGIGSYGRKAGQQGGGSGPRIRKNPQGEP